MLTTITGKNQVTVPAKLASRANIHPGMKLDWELSDEEDVLTVRILPDTASLAAGLRGRGRKHKQGKGSAVDNLVAERAREDGEQ